MLKKYLKTLGTKDYTFPNNNDIIINLQFEFIQQYSTSHALINITDNIRKALSDGNIKLWSFCGFTKSI